MVFILFISGLITILNGIFRRLDFTDVEFLNLTMNWVDVYAMPTAAR